MAAASHKPAMVERQEVRGGVWSGAVREPAWKDRGCLRPAGYRTPGCCVDLSPLRFTP